MVFNPGAAVNVDAFLTLPGSAEVVRESDSSTFRAIVRQAEEVVDGETLIKARSRNLVCAAAVRLQAGESLRIGSRRYEVGYTLDQGLGMLEAVIDEVG